MESTKEILNSIKEHTDYELKNNVVNKSIGRSLIKVNSKYIKVWITNVDSKSSNSYFTNSDLTVRSYNSGIHTYVKDGTVTSKNRTWGRILLKDHQGCHTCVLPTGRRIDFEQFNSSHYSQQSGKVRDLVIGSEELGKYLN